MLATKWVASKLVASLHGPKASEWRPGNERESLGQPRANPIWQKEYVEGLVPVVK
jgi:hypothetical protein